MSLQPFDYASPATLAEATALLTAGDPERVRLLAGGTDLLTLMKAEIAAPEQLVDIKRLTDLTDTIEVTEHGLEIGALATLAELETDPFVLELAPALAQAAAVAASPQLRNMATLGGNLLQRPRCWYFRSPRVQCWLKGGDDCPAREGENAYHALFDQSPCVAVHPSDPATALVALDAEAVLRGPAGERVLPVAALLAPPTEERRTETVLAPDELIVTIRIPPQPDGARSTYLKAMDRNAWAFALVGVGVMVQLRDGRIADARLVLGGVANTPRRAQDAEQALIGTVPDEDVFVRAAEVALAGAQRLAYNGYKVPLAKALVQRALVAVTDAV